MHEIILDREKLVTCLKGIIVAGCPAVSNSDITGSTPLNYKENSLFTSMEHIEKVDSKTSFYTKYKNTELKNQNLNRQRLSLNWAPSDNNQKDPSKRFSQIYQLSQLLPILKSPTGSSVIHSITENSLRDENYSS